MVTTYPPVRVVSPPEFDQGTAQTSGSVRLGRGSAAVGIESALWEDCSSQPGARLGIHHHGEQQTIAYVLSGVCEVRWGARGEYSASAKAGDFIHCTCLPAAHGDQSIGHGILSLGGRAEHFNADRRQPSGRYVAGGSRRAGEQ